MITVEDLVIKLATSTHISIQVFDYKLMDSFTSQLRRGDALTEKQANISLKIIKKYYKLLTAETGINILEFVENPVYKNPFRQSKNIKKISVVDFKDSRFVGKSIKVEFPFNESYINLIRENKLKLGTAFWNKENRAWYFSLCETNIKFLKDLASQENFTVDDEFDQYSRQFDKITASIENYITILSLDNGLPYYKNPNPHLPSIQSKDVLSAIFEARRHGITIWDEQIGEFIESLPNSVLTQFLCNDLNEPFHVNCSQNSIMCLKDIVLNLRPCVIVVPGGSEFEKLSLSYNFLTEIGIDKKNMSVLFRLPNDTGKKLNDFVKYEGLNNPLDDNTEVVFISSKVPKPLIKSKIYFNSIINLGFDNPHYTSRNFIDNHQNLVYFSEKPVQKRFFWDNGIFEI